MKFKFNEKVKVKENTIILNTDFSGAIGDFLHNFDDGETADDPKYCFVVFPTGIGYKLKVCIPIKNLDRLQALYDNLNEVAKMRAED